MTKNAFDIISDLVNPLVTFESNFDFSSIMCSIIIVAKSAFFDPAALLACFEKSDLKRVLKYRSVSLNRIHPEFEVTWKNANLLGVNSEVNCESKSFWNESH